MFFQQVNSFDAINIFAVLYNVYVFVVQFQFWFMSHTKNNFLNFIEIFLPFLKRIPKNIYSIDKISGRCFCVKLKFWKLLSNTMILKPSPFEIFWRFWCRISYHRTDFITIIFTNRIKIFRFTYKKLHIVVFALFFTIAISPKIQPSNFKIILLVFTSVARPVTTSKK